MLICDRDFSSDYLLFRRSICESLKLLRLYLLTNFRPSPLLPGILLYLRSLKAPIKKQVWLNFHIALRI